MSEVILTDTEKVILNFAASSLKYFNSVETYESGLIGGSQM